MDALIITASEKTQRAIADVVNYSGKYNIAFASSGGAARRAICERGFDLIIVNGDLAGERGREIAINAASRKDGGVILLENALTFEETVMDVAEYGVIVVAKPLSKLSLFSAIQTVYSTNMRVQGLKAENKDLNKKLEDLRLVNRAKIALMQHFGYSENQAHKYIEKQAMNQRCAKSDIAKDILRTYEN